MGGGRTPPPGPEGRGDRSPARSQRGRGFQVASPPLRPRTRRPPVAPALGPSPDRPAGPTGSSPGDHSPRRGRVRVSDAPLEPRAASASWPNGMGGAVLAEHDPPHASGTGVPLERRTPRTGAWSTSAAPNRPSDSRTRGLGAGVPRHPPGRVTPLEGATTARSPSASDSLPAEPRSTGRVGDGDAGRPRSLPGCRGRPQTPSS